VLLRSGTTHLMDASPVPSEPNFECDVISTCACVYVCIWICTCKLSCTPLSCTSSAYQNHFATVCASISVLACKCHGYCGWLMCTPLDMSTSGDGSFSFSGGAHTRSWLRTVPDVETHAGKGWRPPMQGRWAVAQDRYANSG